MALITAASRCAICNELLGRRPYLATSGVFLAPADPLSRYCDAPLHWDCYERWPERARFAREHVWSEAEYLATNPYWGMALLTSLVCVTVRKKEPGAARIWLVETGTCVEVALAEWSAWLSDFTRTEQLHRLEIAALRDVVSDLRRRCPTSESMLDAIDWEAKARLGQAQEEDWARRRSAWHEEIRAHNEACRNVFAARDQQGLTCPYCRRQSTDIELVDRTAQERKSFFVCPTCARSFGHDL